MADWKSFEIPIPLAQLADPVRQVLETLMILLDLLKTILDTIKTFLVDFLNPVKALVEALIALIVKVIDALRATGCFAYFDIPDPVHDPNFSRVAGGYQSFIGRFKGSLYDTKDFSRPQPTALMTSGFVLLVVDEENIASLILGVKSLLRLFGRSWKSPRYEAPTDFKAIPVGASGDPILAVTSVFTNGPIEMIELKWSLPTSVESPDPGFTDAFAPIGSEFVPPNFLIEKSVDINPTSQKIDISKLADNDSVGQVSVDAPVPVDKSLASRFSKVDGTTVLATQPLKDDQQEPVIKFQRYITVGTGVDFLGEVTGTFRIIDTDVEEGHVYYYRIRSYSGSLNIDEAARLISGWPTSYGDLKSAVGGNSRTRYFEWPKKGNDDVVMGKPSGVVRAVIPKNLAGFDVIDNLRRLYLTAISLDFHQPLPKENPDGTPPAFDAQGIPIPPTPATYIGKGSLTNVASRLAGFRANLLLEKLAGLDSPGQAFAESSLQTVTMPWQRFNVRNTAARIADGSAQAMLQLGGSEAQAFQSLMMGPLPRGPISTGGLLAGKTTLSDIVVAFTTPRSADDNNEQVLTTFDAAYDDAKLRQNVLVAIQYLQNFTLGGTPPDWIAVAPLRDIVPWAGQMLYDLMAKIEALVAAFNGFLDEIVKFIDLLERKIDAMEKFIQFLIEILDFVEDLNFGAYVLVANNLSGDVSSWVSAIDNAGGTAPSSGPGGYTAGIALAYSLFDAAAISTAMMTIFGG